MTFPDSLPGSLFLAMLTSTLDGWMVKVGMHHSNIYPFNQTGYQSYTAVPQSFFSVSITFSVSAITLIYSVMTAVWSAAWIIFLTTCWTSSIAWHRRQELMFYLINDNCFSLRRKNYKGPTLFLRWWKWRKIEVFFPKVGIYYKTWSWGAFQQHNLINCQEQYC